MSYYGLKVRFNKWLDKAISEDGVDVDWLCLQADNMFGFGELTVKKRLALMERIGMVKIASGVVSKTKR